MVTIRKSYSGNWPKRCAIIIALISLVSMGVLNAQSISRNGPAGQVGVGFTDVGLLINGYFSKSFDQSLRGLLGGAVVIGDISGVDYYGFYLDALASYTLGAVNRGSFRLNGQGGMSLVVDALGEFDNDKIDRSTSFNAAVVGGLEGEFAINKSLSFLLTSNIRYHIKEDFGKIRYHTSLLARFLIGR